MIQRKKRAQDAARLVQCVAALAHTTAQNNKVCERYCPWRSNVPRGPHTQATRTQSIRVPGFMPTPRLLSAERAAHHAHAISSQRYPKSLPPAPLSRRSLPPAAQPSCVCACRADLRSHLWSGIRSDTHQRRGAGRRGQQAGARVGGSTTRGAHRARGTTLSQCLQIYDARVQG